MRTLYEFKDDQGRTVRLREVADGLRLAVDAPDQHSISLPITAEHLAYMLDAAKHAESAPPPNPGPATPPGANLPE